MSDRDQNQDQQDTRSPEEIEADINKTRSHLDDTLSDFQERFSSDHMMHSAMEYVKSDSARDYFSNLGRSVRDNPMPAALIGVGIGWLIYSGNSSSNSSVPSRFNDKRQKRARHAAAETEPQTHEYDELYDEPLFDEPLYSEGASIDQHRHEQSSSNGGGLGQRAKSALHGAGDRARNMKEGAGERAHNMKSGAGDRMQRMKQGSSNRFNDASSKARDAGSWISDMAHDNPVAAGALGLAAGALLGSLIPTSRAEQRAMGETRDHLVDRASEMGSEQMERASDKAREATDQHASDDNDSGNRHQQTPDSRGQSASDSRGPSSSDSSDSEPRFGSSASTDHVPGNTRPGS